MAEWWRIEGWPTAEEWQAFWSFSAVLVSAGALLVGVAGVMFAGVQLRASAVAARRAARAEEAQSRPYVNVRFDLDPVAPADPKETAVSEILVYVMIESVGRTPAVDIALTVTPAFNSSGRGHLRESGPDSVLGALRWVFSGETVISMLGPGERLRYFLDFFKDAVSDPSSIPTRYEVTATYRGAEGDERYRSVFVLDLTPWGPTIPRVEALDLMARQLRRLNENLEKR